MTTPTIAQADLDALTARVAATTLPRLAPSTAAAPGPSQDRAAELLAHWQQKFDWRAVEQQLAELGSQTISTADGRQLWFLHQRTESETPGVAILLVHGWPDSPLRFAKIIDKLTAAGHDVVAPAIPGFGWSTEPEGELSPDLVAADFHALMESLGYGKYAVHAGDWGSMIATTIARSNPDAVAAIHLSDVPFDLAFTIDRDTASAAEVGYLDHIEKFGDALYLVANTQQPNLIATALADSPIGLAAWLAALYDAWAEEPFDNDVIIANAALLLLTSSVRSSMRLYSEPAASWDADWSAEASAESWDETSGGADFWAPEPISIPTAFAMFPADLGQGPRELAEKHFAVQRYTVMPRGGHFAALEEPELLADDLISFLAAATERPN